MLNDYDNACYETMLKKFPHLKMSKNEISNKFKEFELIWNKYYLIIPYETYEFDNYMKIITKIRNNDMNFNDDKKVFLDLLEITSHAIYNDNYEYHEKRYNKDIEYENDELKITYFLKKYLNSYK